MALPIELMGIQHIRIVIINWSYGDTIVTEQIKMILVFDFAACCTAHWQKGAEIVLGMILVPTDHVNFPKESIISVLFTFLFYN